MKRKSILIVDDELHTREALMRYLRGRFDVTGAEDGATALELLKNHDYDLVLTDLRMPGADGMSVLEATLSKAVRPPCIVFTAYGTIENAVAAVKSGAFNFVTKPVKLSQLDEVIDAALASRAEPEPKAADTDVAEKKAGNPTSSGEMVIGNSPAMRRVFELVRDAAPSRINILITGESGTGKEVIARAIHDASGRKGLFVPVHCAALPANLLESELFGHEKGAFTGAVERRKGRFELADGGTIFLDEIGEIEPAIQVKLLRVLESRCVERIGGHEQIRCDARLVAATNRNLAAMVAEGTFREDLYYRLEGISIEMPPLRDRREDIPELTRRFIAAAARENGRGVSGITPQAQQMLDAYSWPGNIRELKHCVERMVVLAHGDLLDVGDIPENIRAGRVVKALMAPAPAPVFAPENGPVSTLMPSPGVVPKLGESERELILRALELCGGNRTRAAAELGISRRTLHRRLHAYGMAGDRQEFNSESGASTEESPA